MRRVGVLGAGELEMEAVFRGEDLQEELQPLAEHELSFSQAAEEGRGAGDLPRPAGAATAAGSRRLSYLNVFVLVVSVGGFLFGFDTGVISGALPYIRDELLQQYAGDRAALARWQELIVSAAIVGAGVGSVAGGWLADRLGRKRALLTADVLFTVGALAMAAAQDKWWLITGRALVGLGVGLASVTVPIYIAEAAPPARRASLVTVNVLMITTGQFVAYVADYVFTFVPGTWRWMLGVAALPSVIQLVALLLLPESPRWLASRGRTAAAQRALQKLQPGSAATAAAAAAASAGAAGGGEAGTGGSSGSSIGGGVPWRLLLTRPVLRELHVGVGLQVLQQVAGINTVMYYTPSILQMAGLQKQTALLLSLVPSATNALGTLVGLRAIDRHGRRRLLLCSIAAVVGALCMLGSAFLAAERHSPQVLPGGMGGDSSGSGSGGGGSCSAGEPPGGGGTSGIPDCTACLRHGCGFCGGGSGGGSGGGGDLMAPGFCLSLDLGAQLAQQAQQAQQQVQQEPATEAAVAAAAAAAAATAGGAAAADNGAAACSPPRQLFLHGCPSPFLYSWLILACLVAYLAAFSPGLGPVPWAVNAEIYPLAVRGVATGLAATANWVSNAVVAQTFLTLTSRLGGSGAFYLYSAIACAGFVWTNIFLPETNGLTLEQVQQLFGAGGGTADAGGSVGGRAGGGGAGSSGSGGGGSVGWGRRERKQRASDDEAEGLVGGAAGPG